jgi:hypothetical protein
MRFHLPSFMLGVATGASGAALAPRLRPLVLEIATGYYRIFDAAMLRIARGRENLSDLAAEARSRARDRLRARGVRSHVAEAHA